jgi:energy-coupling factor transporter transmembrane protein EcfT
MGFVQARIQVRHGALGGAALTAPLFALQHISLFLGGGAVTALVILVLATLVMFFHRAFNAWLYNSSGSLFLVGLVHATGNAIAPGNGFAPGYLRQLYPADTELVGVLHAVAFALLAIVLILVTRGRLGFTGGSDGGPDEDAIEGQSRTDVWG